MPEPLCYGADDVANLLAQLAHPDHNETRRGRGDHTLRGVAADALDEEGRAEEAALLRPDFNAGTARHVMIGEDGRVLPGRFSSRPAQDAFNNLMGYLSHINGGDYPVPDIDVLEPGDESGVGHRLPEEWRTSIRPGTVRLVIVNQNTDNPDRGPQATDIGNPFVPQQLWEWARNHMNFVDPFEFEFPDMDAALDTVEQMLEAIRTAPYEEPDLGPTQAGIDHHLRDAANAPQPPGDREFFGEQPVHLARGTAPTPYGPAEEHASFRHAIDENPHDRTTQLVFGDWLDDQGRHDEAKDRRELAAWMARYETRQKPLRIGRVGSGHAIIHMRAPEGDVPPDYWQGRPHYSVTYFDKRDKDLDDTSHWDPYEALQEARHWAFGVAPDTGFRDLINRVDLDPPRPPEGQPELYGVGGRADSDGLSAHKAREILHDGTVHGHPITDRQRRYFGWVSGGHEYNMMDEDPVEYEHSVWDWTAELPEYPLTADGMTYDCGPAHYGEDVPDWRDYVANRNQYDPHHMPAPPTSWTSTEYPTPWRWNIGPQPADEPSGAEWTPDGHPMSREPEQYGQAEDEAAMAAAVHGNWLDTTGHLVMADMLRDHRGIEMHLDEAFRRALPEWIRARQAEPPVTWENAGYLWQPDREGDDRYRLKVVDSTDASGNRGGPGWGQTYEPRSFRALGGHGRTPAAWQRLYNGFFSSHPNFETLPRADQFWSGRHTDAGPDARLTPAENALTGIDQLENVDPSIYPQLEALLRDRFDRGVRLSDPSVPVEYDRDATFHGHTPHTPWVTPHEAMWHDWGAQHRYGRFDYDTADELMQHAPWIEDEFTQAGYSRQTSPFITSYAQSGEPYRPQQSPVGAHFVDPGANGTISERIEYAHRPKYYLPGSRPILPRPTYTPGQVQLTPVGPKRAPDEVQQRLRAEIAERRAREYWAERQMQRTEFAAEGEPTEYGELDELRAAIHANPLDTTGHRVWADRLQEEYGYGHPDELFRRAVADSVERRLNAGWRRPPEEEVPLPQPDPWGFGEYLPRPQSVRLIQPHPHGALDPFTSSYNVTAAPGRPDRAGRRPAHVEHLVPARHLESENLWQWVLPAGWDRTDRQYLPPDPSAPRDIFEWQDRRTPDSAGAGHQEGERLWAPDPAHLTSAERTYAGIDDLSQVDPAVWPQVEAIMRDQFDRGQRLEDDENPVDYALYAEDAPTDYGDREDLQEAIRQNPFEFTPRGMLADWHQEQGDEREADFQRKYGEWMASRLTPEMGLQQPFALNVHRDNMPAWAAGRIPIGVPQGKVFPRYPLPWGNDVWGFNDEGSMEEAFRRAHGRHGPMPDTPDEYLEGDEQPEMYADGYAPMAGTHTEEDFLRRIIENPEDRNGALIFADWLDENGQAAKARLIRAHVEQRETGAEEIPVSPLRWAGQKRLHGGPGAITRPGEWTVSANWYEPRSDDVEYPGGVEWRADFPPDDANAIARELLRSGHTPHGGSYWQEGYDSYFGAHGQPHQRIYDQAPSDPERLSRYADDTAPRPFDPTMLPDAAQWSAKMRGLWDSWSPATRETRGLGFDWDPRMTGMCLDASIALRHELAREGVASRVVAGYHKNLGGADHYWVELADGTHLDPTASQIHPDHPAGQIRRLLPSELGRGVWEVSGEYPMDGDPEFQFPVDQAAAARVARLSRYASDDTVFGPTDWTWDDDTGRPGHDPNDIFNAPDVPWQFPFDPTAPVALAMRARPPQHPADPWGREYEGAAPLGYGLQDDIDNVYAQTLNQPLDITRHLVMADMLRDQHGEGGPQEGFRRAVGDTLTRRLSAGWSEPMTDRSEFLHQMPWGPEDEYKHEQLTFRPRSETFDWVRLRPALSSGHNTRWVGAPYTPDRGWVWDAEYENLGLHREDNPIRALPELSDWRDARRTGNFPGVPWNATRHPHDLAPSERLFAGIDNLANLDPKHWPALEALMRDRFDRGERLEDDEDPTEYATAGFGDSWPEHDAGQFAYPHNKKQRGLLDKAVGMNPQTLPDYGDTGGYGAVSVPPRPSGGWAMPKRNKPARLEDTYTGAHLPSSAPAPTDWLNAADPAEADSFDAPDLPWNHRQYPKHDSAEYPGPQVAPPTRVTPQVDRGSGWEHVHDDPLPHPPHHPDDVLSAHDILPGRDDSFDTWVESKHGPDWDGFKKDWFHADQVAGRRKNREPYARYDRAGPVFYGDVEDVYRAVQANPDDWTTRAILADALDEHHGQVTPTSEFLRTHQGPAWVAQHPETGEFSAGPRHSWDDLRALNGEEYRWEGTNGRNEHFGFFPAFFDNEEYAEMLPSGDPYSGPGGSFFVTDPPPGSEYGPAIDGRRHSSFVWTLHPDTNGISMIRSGRAVLTPEQAHQRAAELAATHPRVPA